MKLIRFSISILGATFVSLGGVWAASSYEETVRPFLDTYCIKCHGPDKQKGDRRYDTLAVDFSDEESMWLWQDIADQLNLGEMPPSKSKQPGSSERLEVVAWVTEKLDVAYDALKSTGGQTVFRRLNRVEYDRTVRDLLSLEPMLSDPTETFPPDETEEGFVNIGSALSTSDFLLQGYLDAAEAYVDAAAMAGGKPQVKRYQFEAPFYKTSNRHDGKDVDGQFQHIRKNTTDEGGYLWLSKLEKGVPSSGYYELRFKARAIDREYPYEEKYVGTRKSEPLRVEVVAGSSAYGDLENRTSSDRTLEEFVISEDEAKWYESRIWLDAGFQPRLTFPNGPNRVKPLRKSLVMDYPDSFQEYIDEYLLPSDNIYPYSIEESVARKIAEEAKRIATFVPENLDTKGTSSRMNARDGWAAFYRGYHGPRIRVFEIELEGPFFESWPPPSYRALFGNFEPKVSNAKPILKRFSERAFRRPVEREELNALVGLAKAKHEAGLSEFEALKIGLRAALCSPGFLFLQESDGTLDDYALASRLSYFLWSSQPDKELRKLARRGDLGKTNTLRKQAARMLKDERARAFTEQFTERWLELYKIGSMPPSPKDFESYYVDGLERSMKRETQLFFQNILDENLPIDRFLDADFTFVDSGLARLYGIEGMTGSEFRKIPLGPDSRRGGLLGQASVLTASANGIDTSPVIRGIWVLENILGTPPSPPPPDVEPLEPDIRGATTIRDQLKKHRTVETCNECHRKIDPLGFALENYDPIGGWRDRYRRGGSERPVVDASGQLPNGETFENVEGLKAILAERIDQFSRCLTEKMLAYSTGRTLEYSDRPEVDRIVADLDRQGNGLQELVYLIVESEAFRTK
ncbi:MAG: DUF1592 domain-containing protein [Opitutales bacterium]|nr:DUF1592 domain-containing protein [Opitutales bacterium]MBT5816637.1 DUF1592 domain-containing protein [Opitutales bacterium]